MTPSLQRVPESVEGALMEYAEKREFHAAAVPARTDAMPSFADNPYPPGTSDHLFWEQYHAAYLAQPVSAQLFELQSQVRGIWTELVHIKEGMEGSPVSEECGVHLSALIAAMDELERLADGLDDDMPQATS